MTKPTAELIAWNRNRKKIALEEMNSATGLYKALHEAMAEGFAATADRLAEQEAEISQYILALREIRRLMEAFRDNEISEVRFLLNAGHKIDKVMSAEKAKALQPKEAE